MNNAAICDNFYGQCAISPHVQEDGAAFPRVLVKSAHFEHLGCFQDKKDDRVLRHTMKSDDMTTEVR